MVEGLGVHFIFSGGVKKKKKTSSKVRLRASKQNVKSGAIATARRLSRSTGACAGSEDGFLQLARIDGGRRVGERRNWGKHLTFTVKKGRGKSQDGGTFGGLRNEEGCMAQLALQPRTTYTPPPPLSLKSTTTPFANAHVCPARCCCRAVVFVISFLQCKK